MIPWFINIGVNTIQLGTHGTVGSSVHNASKIGVTQGGEQIIRKVRCSG